MIALCCALMLAATPAPSPGPTSSAAQHELERKAWEDLDKGSLPDGGRPPLHPPFRWQVQNVIEDIDMPGMQEAAGIPVKLHAVRVKNNLRGVAEDIVNTFVKQGLYVQPVDQQPQPTAELQVTGLDADRYISYTAIIRPERNGTCTVVLGEANVGLAIANKTLNKGKDDFAPLPELARHAVRAHTEGLDSVTFAVAMPEPELKKWYAEELKKRGYVEHDGGFLKDTELITVRSRFVNGETQVLLMRRTVRPGEL